MNKIIAFFTSLKLTVVLLAFAIGLVFIGTLAQVDEGLYAAQAHYFRQWVVFGAHLFGRDVPLVLPGGYLLGALLLVNLLAAHIYRFQLTPRKIGIQLIHAGIIVLLAGQLAADLLARETQMRLAEGDTRDYSESAADSELVFESATVGTAIPARLLQPGGELNLPGLPFSVRVKDYWRNSDVNFRAPIQPNAPPLTTNGLAMNFDFVPRPPVKTTEERNIPTVVLELAAPGGSLGTWVASGWAGDASLVAALRDAYAQQAGAEMAQKIAAQLAAPQAVEVDGRRYTFALRSRRVGHGFSLTLLQATHKVYPGTDIPKDFRSRVRLHNPRTGEQREVEISMNYPLRYGGYTFYQYQMLDPEQARRAPVSVLSVVRNPGWLAPYAGCLLVGAGLTIQFLMHLVGFIAKRRAK